jgi:hypothetical protein
VLDFVLDGKNYRNGSPPIQSASGALGAGEPFGSGASSSMRRSRPSVSSQEARALLAFGLAVWTFDVSAFTRPVSATTWGAAVIDSHPGKP